MGTIRFIWCLILLTLSVHAGNDKIIEAYGSSNLKIRTNSNDRLTIDTSGVIGLPDLSVNSIPYIDASNNLITTSGLTFDGSSFLFPITDGNILIGNGSNLKSEVTVSGDISLNNLGVSSINPEVILDADVNSAANINATKLGTGLVDNTEFNLLDGVTGTLVTETGLQTLTNKTITGADFRTPLRLDVKQDTEANLVTYALTATEGQLVWATDSDKLFYILANTLVEVGTGTGTGSGNGSLNTFHTERFEDNVDASTFTCDNGTSFGTSGGTLGGVISDETVSQIKGTKSLKFTLKASPTSLNDWCYSPIISLENKENEGGQNVGLKIWYKYNGNTDDVQLVLWDETNDKVISSSLELLPSVTKPTEYFTAAISIPNGVTQIRYGFYIKNHSNSAELIIDDISLDINPTIYKDVLNIEEWATYNATIDSLDNPTDLDFRYRVVGDTLEVRGSGVAGASPSGGNVAFYIPSQFTIDVDKLRMGDNRNPLGLAQRLNTGVRAKADAGNEALVFSDGTTTNKVFISRELYPSTTSITPSTGSGWLAGNDGFTVNFSVPIIGSATKPYVLLPAEESITTTKFLTANVNTQGDMSDLTFTGLTIGHRYLITGNMDLSSFDNQATEIHYRSEAGGTGAIYGRSEFHIGAGTSFGRAAFGVSIEFTAQSSTLYVRKADANPKTVYGDGTTYSTFIQLTNITRQFLAAVPVEEIAYIDVNPTVNRFTHQINATTSYKTRTLNYLRGDTGFASIASNQLTLRKGKYELTVPISGFNGTGWMHFLLRNITDSVDQVEFTEVAYSDVLNISPTSIPFTLELSKDTVFEFRTRASAAAGDEVIGRIKIRKLR